MNIKNAFGSVKIKSVPKNRFMSPNGSVGDAKKRAAVKAALFLEERIKSLFFISHFQHQIHVLEDQIQNRFFQQ